MHRSRDAWNRPWSFVVATSTTYLALDVPLRAVLRHPPVHALSMVTWVIDVVLIIDFLFHLRRAGWLGGSANSDETDRAQSKWWLLVDLLAAIPVHLFRVPQFLGLIRLVKLGRIAQMMNQWRHEAIHSTVALRLALFAFWLGLLAHWISCGWLALLGLDLKQTELTNYIRSLYWCVTTMATVGYGDISPDKDNNAQMLYATGVMILGAGVYGYVIANVASILSNIDPARVRYRETIERLSVFMRYRDIPPELQKRIIDYNAYLWEKRLGYDEESAIAGLPPTLRAEVSLHLNREIIEKVPLFRGASEEFVRAVALEMRPVIFMPGDWIMRAGETGNEMYFISRGAIEILTADGKTVLAKLGSGAFFGEMALLLNQPRSASARAAEYCDLYVLEKATFQHILGRFPDFARHVEEVAAQRQKA